MFDKRRDVTEAGFLHQLETRIPRKVEVMKQLNVVSAVAVCLLCMQLAPDAQARTFTAGPDNYSHMLTKLSPGDTLQLAGGYYFRGLRIHGMEGRDGAPITIAGATAGPPTVFFGRQGHNTISIKNAAYVTVRDLELDGRGAFVDAVKAEGNADYAHHITLQNLYIHNLVAHQQSVGISTKCPAWDWVVKGNRIIGTGTGMYFGNSDGSAPFIGGLIEGNEVIDSIGYNLQIKHQIARPALIGIPIEQRMTIIRRNRFIKERNSSAGPSARPNVLVGHFPLQGPGENDEYAIYGNLFYQNPGEALFQGEGNIALYNNLFFNSHDNDFPTVALQPHNDVPKQIHIFGNTVVHPSKGIRVLPGTGSEDFDQRVVGNAVFANEAIDGGAQSDNFVAAFSEVFQFLQSPVPDPATLSLAPCGERLRATHRITLFADYPESDRDFNGTLREGRDFGALASTAGNRCPSIKLPSVKQNEPPS